MPPLPDPKVTPPRMTAASELSAEIRANASRGCPESDEADEKERAKNGEQAGQDCAANTTRT